MRFLYKHFHSKITEVEKLCVIQNSSDMTCVTCRYPNAFLIYPVAPRLQRRAPGRRLLAGMLLVLFTEILAAENTFLNLHGTELNDSAFWPQLT